MTGTFPVEPIPDSAWLFRRVYRGYIKKGKVKANAFSDPLPRFEGQRVGVSVQWEKYATAQLCKDTGKEPKDNGVATLLTGKVREIDELLVEHDPQPSLRAHSQIYGEKDEEVRLQLARLANLVLTPD